MIKALQVELFFLFQLCHQEKLNEYIRLITDQPGKNKKEKSIIAVKERVQMKQQKLKFRVSKITTQREFDNSIIVRINFT